MPGLVKAKVKACWAFRRNSRFFRRVLEEKWRSFWNADFNLAMNYDIFSKLLLFLRHRHWKQQQKNMEMLYYLKYSWGGHGHFISKVSKNDKRCKHENLFIQIRIKKVFSTNMFLLFYQMLEFLLCLSHESP